MPDTDRLALADELEKLANGGSMGYYVANESLLREAAAALRAMPTPAGEDAELVRRLRESYMAQSQVGLCIEAADRIEALSAAVAEVREMPDRDLSDAVSWDAKAAITGWNGALSVVRRILGIEALSATPGPASPQEPDDDPRYYRICFCENSSGHACHCVDTFFHLDGCKLQSTVTTTNG